MKRPASFHLLRVGMAVTFLWIGVLIFKDPLFWAGFIKPWAAALIPGPLDQAMLSTAVLDIAIGFFLLIDVFAWVAGLIGAIHLAIVLAVAGIDVITVRDIGLFAGCLALFWEDLPENIRAHLKRHQTT